MVGFKFNLPHKHQTNSDFDAKPMVMLLGQYSTGKTTFIKHLLRSSYPGAHIGQSLQRTDLLSPWYTIINLKYLLNCPFICNVQDKHLTISLSLSIFISLGVSIFISLAV